MIITLLPQTMIINNTDQQLGPPSHLTSDHNNSVLYSQSTSERRLWIWRQCVMCLFISVWKKWSLDLSHVRCVWCWGPPGTVHIKYQQFNSNFSLFFVCVWRRINKKPVDISNGINNTILSLQTLRDSWQFSEDYLLPSIHSGDCHWHNITTGQ